MLGTAASGLALVLGIAGIAANIFGIAFLPLLGIATGLVVAIAGIAAGGTLVAANWGEIAPVIQPVLKFFQQLVSFIGGKVAQAWQIGDKIFQTIHSLSPELADFLNPMHALKQAWDDLSKALQTATPLWQLLGLVIGAVGVVILAMLTAALMGIAKFIQGIALALAGVIQVASGIVQLVVTLLTFIASLFVNF
ncbi:hypothetical protein EPA93_14305 [Ktedonosporobacter rubrisoli]|uniref:Uncharacterized protein n=1 Tax=Ktedonosporobacter rubrisoli TaxID=2509675 RepID=A0A4P6JP37_KTERU|nr:hypothetical protein [Ktedonosporobacter rubrisoli]QBD77108.1 hypothetical protein EPA93_14305 [Ktedonosporobacter rubrisoli]